MDARPEPPPVRPCPGCGEPLAAMPLDALSCLGCRACGGRWVAPEEVEAFLRAFAGRAGVEAGPPLQRRTVIVHADGLARPTGGKPCPLCREAMELLNYGYDSNVVVDRCPNAHGLWLPAADLPALAAFVKGHERLEPVLERLRAERAEREQNEELVSDALYGASAVIPALPLAFMPVDTENDETPQAPPPRVGVGLLILANVVVYALQPHDPSGRNAFFRHFGLVPAIAWIFVWQFFTSMFIHGSLGHLIGNMMGLWLVGRDLESERGTLRFLKLYVNAGLFGGLLSLFGPNPRSIGIGASGAIAGLFAAFIRLFPDARLSMWSTAGRRTVSARLFFGIWFAQQVWFWAHHPNWHVGWLAHIGGFLAGWLLAVPGPAPAPKPAPKPRPAVLPPPKRRLNP